MNNIVITIRSSEIPDIPNLEAIDSEKLLKDIISQLSSGKYQIIAQEPGPLFPIEGYKTPMEESEILLNVCVRDSIDIPNNDDEIITFLHKYIVDEKLKVMLAVRHTQGKLTRVVANIDS